MTSKVRHIIWAVDPFENNIPLDQAALQELVEWTQKNEVTVEPVHVVTHVVKEFIDTKAIEGVIQDFFALLGLSIKRPTILINPTKSVAGAVHCLKDHIENSEADLLVVSSHGRTGYPRLSMGSFAEALLTVSPVPLLFMNQKRRAEDAKIGKVLWATDLSEKCRDAFLTFLNDARGVAFEIIVLYDDTFTVEAMKWAAYSGSGAIPSDEMLQEQHQWAVDEVEKLVLQARSHGYKAHSIVGTNVRDISNSILEVARSNQAGMVVMATAGGSLRPILLGSEAYNVFRSGEFPVWIYGPEASVKSRINHEGRIF